MATNVASNKPSSGRAFQAGQRLQCTKCGSEIEITNPCTCNPPDQVLQCCGIDMVPTTPAETG
jgi:hypothetical protein